MGGWRRIGKKMEKRRQDREKLDQELIAHMSAQIGVHPLNFGIDDKTRRTDVCINKAIFEQMGAENFLMRKTSGLLKLTREKDVGKLEPMGSVPRPHPDAQGLARLDEDSTCS